MAQQPNPENRSNSSISLNIDGETINIAPQVAIGWQDILKSRVGVFVDIEEPVSPTFQTKFNYGVLSDLREDINLMRTASMDKPPKECATTPTYTKLSPKTFKN